MVTRSTRSDPDEPPFSLEYYYFWSSLLISTPFLPDPFHSSIVRLLPSSLQPPPDPFTVAFPAIQNQPSPSAHACEQPDHRRPASCLNQIRWPCDHQPDPPAPVSRCTGRCNGIGNHGQTPAADRALMIPASWQRHCTTPVHRNPARRPRPCGCARQPSPYPGASRMTAAGSSRLAADARLLAAAGRSPPPIRCRRRARNRRVQASRNRRRRARTDAQRARPAPGAGRLPHRARGTPAANGADGVPLTVAGSASASPTSPARYAR